MLSFEKEDGIQHGIIKRNHQNVRLNIFEQIHSNYLTKDLPW